MCYVAKSQDSVHIGWCGDGVGELMLEAYADSDFASDQDTSRSTPGGCLLVSGPDTSFVISALSKRQSVVSHSTPEAEIVAADYVVRTAVLPAFGMWELVLARPVHAVLFEDNSACVQVCRTGHNPTMRVLQRTHKVSVAWLHECFQVPNSIWSKLTPLLRGLISSPSRSLRR